MSFNYHFFYNLFRQNEDIQIEILFLIFKYSFFNLFSLSFLISQKNRKIADMISGILTKI